MDLRGIGDRLNSSGALLSIGAQIVMPIAGDAKLSQIANGADLRHERRPGIGQLRPDLTM
jgi:hypothetical protein